MPKAYSGSTSVVVARIPNCDVCAPDAVPAVYDGRTRMGMWAYMCEGHMTTVGVGLGTGYGQRLILEGTE